MLNETKLQTLTAMSISLFYEFLQVA